VVTTAPEMMPIAQSYDYPVTRRTEMRPQIPPPYPTEPDSWFHFNFSQDYMPIIGIITCLLIIALLCCVVEVYCTNREEEEKQQRLSYRPLSAKESIHLHGRQMGKKCEHYHFK
jgi:hypothetical protein